MSTLDIQQSTDYPPLISPIKKVYKDAAHGLGIQCSIH
jgi:hypothetical protein